MTWIVGGFLLQGIALATVGIVVSRRGWTMPIPRWFDVLTISLACIGTIMLIIGELKEYL